VLVVDLVDLRLAEEAGLAAAAAALRASLPGRAAIRFRCQILSLERDVVVGALEVGVRGRRRTGRHELAAAGLAVAAAAEDLDGLGDDLDGLALPAVLGLPLAPVEAPVDRDGAALREVLRATVCLVAEDGDAEVVGLVDPLARLVAPAAVD